MVIVNQIQIHILVKKLLNCQLCWLILASIGVHYVWIIVNDPRHDTSEYYNRNV